MTDDKVKEAPKKFKFPLSPKSQAAQRDAFLAF